MESLVYVQATRSDTAGRTACERLSCTADSISVCESHSQAISPAASLSVMCKYFIVDIRHAVQRRGVIWRDVGGIEGAATFSSAVGRIMSRLDNAEGGWIVTTRILITRLHALFVPRGRLR